jgi:hypothetical protein
MLLQGCNVCHNHDLMGLASLIFVHLLEMLLFLCDGAYFWG